MKIITVFFVFTAFILSVVAQENSQEKWSKILSPKKDLTLLIPGDFLVDNEGDTYRVYAYQNEVRITFTAENTSQAKARLKMMRTFRYPGSKAEVKRFSLGDFDGDTYSYPNKDKDKDDDDDGYFSMSIYTASSKAFYTITVSSKVKTNKTLEKFLYSIRLDKAPLLKQANPVNIDAEQGAALDELKSSPAVLEALKKPDAKRAKIIYEKKSDDEKKTEPIKYSRPVIVLRKVQARYTDSARQQGVQGSVMLRVVFRADAQIGEITVIKKLSGGLTENAVEAVRKIKFLPAEIDGKAVDTTRTVSYTFTIY